MAEVLASFPTPVTDELGDYHARAVGRQAADNMWEAWIEFVPIETDGGVVVTGVESRQPARQHLEYWATGLTSVYLEGALRRAKNPLTMYASPVDRAASDRPAPLRVVHSTIPLIRPILDPFEVGLRNINILRQALTALDRPRLLRIISAYHLQNGADTTGMSDPQLVTLIVSGVESRARYPA